MDIGQCNISQLKRNGPEVRAIKFEKAWVRFLSDVFAAVAVVAAEAPGALLMERFTGADERRISLHEEIKSKKLFLSHHIL